MTVFAIEGIQIDASVSGDITRVAQSNLQIISRIGINSLGANYCNQDPSSAAISLSDYNLVLNETHLNDGPLPEEIELFKLEWHDGTETKQSHVLSFVFHGADGQTDCLFSVAEQPLPSLTTAHEVANFMDNAKLSKLQLHTGTFTIALTEMPDVSVSGVMADPEEAVDEIADDMFIFAGSKSDAAAADQMPHDVVWNIPEDTRPAADPAQLALYKRLAKARLQQWSSVQLERALAGSFRENNAA